MDIYVNYGEHLLTDSFLFVKKSRIFGINLYALTHENAWLRRRWSNDRAGLDRMRKRWLL